MKHIIPKTLWITFILLSNIFTLNANIKSEKDSLSVLLKSVLDKKQYYVDQKENRIKDFKQSFLTKDISPQQQYGINKYLMNEYEKYIVDSAVVYINKNMQIALQIGDKDLINETNIALASLYSTTGLYLESKTILDKIDRNSLNDKCLSEYYEAYSFFCDHYRQSNLNYSYYEIGQKYNDSLLMTLDPLSDQYSIVYSKKLISEGHLDKAMNILDKVMQKSKEDDRQKALTSFLISTIYKEKDDVINQKKYLTISAIVDIKNAIKDNASQQALALVYYNEGNIDFAFRLMKSALDDALFANVRYRVSEGSAFYPVINASYQVKEASQKKRILGYLILISVLSLFLIIAITYIYKQVKRLAKIRKQQYHTNLKLNDVNNDLKLINEKLKISNDKLQDSNRIKEEYIALFFDLFSININKMETSRKSLYKKVVNKQYEDLYKELKSSAFIDRELEEFYHLFDTIFLNIYPTFIEKFNELLIDSEKVIPKPGELLNTELRIFALIRLGINDSVKIAGFLRYSLSTIYNYRTKVRNKAAVSRDDFEKNVMQIGS